MLSTRVRIAVAALAGALLLVQMGAGRGALGTWGARGGLEGSGARAASERFEFTKLLMGVEARVVLYAENEAKARRAAMLAFDRIARLEDVMSDYRPGSEVMRVCDEAGRPGGGAVEVSEDLAAVLRESLRMAELTDGAFDPTVGPLVKLWREARREKRLAATEVIAEARARTGWRHVHLDEKARPATVSFDVPGMRLDFGGIGKGFAAGAAGEVLRREGVTSFLVALAGDIVVGDAPPGETGWKVAVATGAQELGGEPTLELEKSAVSTSGDAEQFVEIEGVRYAHIVDPRTGLGVTSRVGATVIGQDAGMVDALATAVCVLGADKGMDLMRDIPGYGVMIVEREDDSAPLTRRATPGFGAGEGDDGWFDPANEPPEGFVALFNGKDLDGWRGLAADPVQRAKMTTEELAKAQAAADQKMREHWRVEDGVLVFDGKGDSLQSVRPYGDFELYVDWKIEKGGDSGIYVRGSPQVQIWDNPIGSGGLYNNEKNPSKPLVVADRPVGEWNRFHILMQGEKVTVWLNDKLVADNVVLENYWERSKPIFAQGPIELQNHGNTLRFKNIFVRDPSARDEVVAAEAREPGDDQRMAWWREARFGMFIHWGLYAIPAGVWEGKPVNGIGEWIMFEGKVPVAEYEKLLPRFNPVKFDARAWARLMKEAGIKYVTITSKHHDGFALYDSKVSDYDVMATPFKRDILKELSAACKAEGITFCTYHSIMDWHHPDYLPRRPWDPRPEVKADFEKYIAYMKGQLREIVTGYDPGVLWFDGEWEDTWTHERGVDLHDYVRSLKPSIIINNRVDKGRAGMAGLTTSADFRGDFGTPEQEVPATGIPGVDWESCMTMNDTWGFKADDHNWKSTETLIRTLVDIASKGGNFLLNVGPTAEGEIPAPSVERLRAMGAWLKINGASVYGTHAGPFAKLPWGRCTAKVTAEGSHLLYLHVFEWPRDGMLRLPGLMNEVKSARLLLEGSATLAVEGDGTGVVVRVPWIAPARIDTVTVVQLEIVGEPAVVTPPIPAVRAAADGSLTLSAEGAQIKGQTARYEPAEQNQNIGYWTSASDVVWWPVEIANPAKFRVTLEYACAPGNGGRFLIVGPDGGAGGDVTPTGSWTTFRTIEVGELEFKRRGRAKIEVRPVSIPSGGLMNLRSVKLTPAG